MSLMEQRAAALAAMTPTASPTVLVEALAEIEATVAEGLSLPPDQMAALVFCASHADSSVCFGWARVMCRRVWRNTAVGPALDRLWRWSEQAPEATQDRRRAAWLELARLLPARGQPTPLMGALIKAWRRAPEGESEEMLELVERFAAVVALPDDAAALLAEGVHAAGGTDVAERSVRLWCRLALAADGERRDLAAQAAWWLSKGAVATDPVAESRLVTVVALRGDMNDIKALRSGQDAAFDEELARSLAGRLRPGGDNGDTAALLARLAIEHGGGVAWEALAALRKGLNAGATLSGALPELRRHWAQLSYDRGPWAQPMSADLSSDLSRQSAARDALFLVAAAAEQDGDALADMAATLRSDLSELARADLAHELGGLDRYFGVGAADRARKSFGLAD